MEDTLLPPKMALPQPPSSLDRPRLREALAAAPAVLLVAGPGWGKTVLLAQGLRYAPGSVGYYLLDELDTDFRHFIAHLVAVTGQPCVQTRALLAGSDLDSGRLVGLAEATKAESRLPAAVLRALAATLAAELKPPLTLALDDLHALPAGAPALQFLAALLRYQPQGVQLWLASRTVPQELAAERLRLEGRLRLIDADMLAFTPDETADLFRTVFGQDVPHRAVAQAGGWPVALYLCQAAGSRVRELPQDDLYRYLAGEVLASQTPDRQEFLLRTSVLASLEPEVCAQVCPGTGAATALAELARTGLVTVAGAHYRYHPLFREFLLTRLAESGAAPAAHLQAAEALAGSDPAAAVDHCLAAGEPARAAALLPRLPAMSPYPDRLRRWCRGLPPELYPEMRLLAAEAAITACDPAAALAWAVELPPTARVRICRGLAMMQQGRFDAARTELSGALAGMNEHLPGFADAALHAATIDLRQGRADSIPLLERALAVYRSSGDLSGEAHALATLAIHRYLTGDLEQAFAELTDVCRRAEGLISWGLCRARATLGLGLLRAGHGHFALTELQQALVQAEQLELSGFAAVVRAGLAHATVLAGAASEAAELAAAAVRQGQGALPEFRTRLLAEAAAAYHLLGGLPAAVVQVRTAVTLAAECQDPFEPEYRCTLARLLIARGEAAGAKRALARIPRLLQPHHHYFRLQYEQVLSEVNRQSALTERELEVLRCLARGESNSAIARSLHISEGTVKTHVIHIFRKLDVGNRVQAVRRAGKLGLIAPE